jgi:peroxiredoxin
MTVTDSQGTGASDPKSKPRRVDPVTKAAQTGIGAKLNALRDGTSFLPSGKELRKLARARDGVAMMNQAPRVSSDGIGPLEHMIRMVPTTRRHSPPRLNAGDRAPGFDLAGSHGLAVSSASLAGKPYALRLTRAIGTGIICPACVPGLDELTRTHGDFTAAGCELVVVFPVSAAHATEVVDALELPYPVYSDESRLLFTAYETRFSAGAPLPAWVVVDGDGVIRFVWRATEGGLYDKYPESAEILAELRKLREGR